MGEHEVLGIAIVAVPIIMNFLKAAKLEEFIGKDLIPYVAGFMGIAVVIAGTWLTDSGDPFEKETIVHALIGAFGPSGFYEMALKHVPGLGTLGTPASP